MMARRLFYGRGSTKKVFKDEPPQYDPGPQTKIDALVRMHTGFSSLKQMCKSNPTLRAPPGASNREKRDFAQLREAYKRVTDKEAMR
jgi:hypothetical protein